MTHDRPLVLRYAARSDVGLRRQGNEDSAYASPRLLAVADGIGGQSHGEVASAAAITVLADFDERLGADPRGADLLATLAEAVAEISRRLREMAEGDADLSGMGTTLTAMLWDGGRFAVAHIGDSRGYLLRDGSLHQITKDHTMVQSLVDSGRISAAQAAEHPRRSVLTRALHTGGPVDPDLALWEAQPGDRFLLCSDGLSSVAPAESLVELLTGVADPDEVVPQLIDLANQHGGPDNITCVVADVVGAGESAPEATGEVAGEDSGEAGRLVVGAAAD